MQLEKKLKIAIVHPRFNEFGGAERVILNLCRHWVANGHSVTVFSFCFSKEFKTQFLNLNCRIKKTSIPFLPFLIINDLSPLNIKLTSLILRTHIKNFDIVNVHNSPATLWCAYAKKRKKMPPIVWSCHEYDRLLYRSLFDDKIEVYDSKTVTAAYKKDTEFPNALAQRVLEMDQKLIPLIDHIVCNSAFTASNIRKIYGIVADNYPFGIKMPKQHYTKPRKSMHTVQFGVVSRLEKQKGLLHAIRAIHAFHLKYPSVAIKLDTVGAGCFRSVIENYISDHGLHKTVKLHGFVSEGDLIAFYKSWDAVMYCPFNEPLGLVPIEAGLYQLPVIVSDHGGPIEVVLDKKTGFHVSVEDTDAVVSKIKKIIDNLGSNEMGKAAQKHVANTFDVEGFSSYLEQTFQVLVNNTVS